MSYWCHVCPACVELELWEWEDRSPFSSKDCSCTSANSWLVNPGHNWTSWRTAHISRLSTDHREKSICEVIKAVPQATVMHVQEVVQYSMFTPTHSFKMFQNVSSSIVSRSFRTVSLAGWAANTLNQASLGTWTGCAPQIFTAPPNPLGPSGLSVHVCILWFSDKKSGSLHKNDRKDQVMVWASRPSLVYSAALSRMMAWTKSTSLIECPLWKWSGILVVINMQERL